MDSWKLISSPNSVITNLRSLLFSSDLSDFTILITESNLRIPTHRQILASASPYFASVLYGPYVEGSNKELRVSDIDSAIFQSLIRFIYTGETEVSITNIVKLIQSANRFCVTEAIKEFNKAAQEMLENLDASDEAIDKVCMILCESYYGKLDDICEMCLEYIDLNTRAFIESESFLQVPCEILEQVFSRDTLYDGVKEISLYLACLRWARGKGNLNCKVQENFEVLSILPEKNSDLGKLTRQIRLPLIKAKHIINKIDTAKLFTNEELYTAMAYQACPEPYQNSPNKIFKERAGSKKPWRWSEEKIGSHILLSNDKNLAIAHHYDWEKVLGNTIWYAGTHSFKVQLELNITVSSNSWQIIIGVASPSTSLIEHLGSGGKEWGLACYSGHKISCGDRREEYTGSSKKGDIIEVKLDLSLKKLEFFKEGRSLGIAFSNVTPPVCPAVSLLKGQRVRLIWD